MSDVRKPLELVIFEDLNERKRPVACARADIEGRRKRLTDVELAAEVWRSKFQTMNHPGMGEALRTAALHRFATLPHYDEERA